MTKSEEVAEYLRQNPAFFEEHQDVLADLQVGDTQLPFHQRQVQVLKQRHSAEQARYEMVVDSARNNQELELSLHQLAQKLLSEKQGSPGSAEAIIAAHFSLRHVKVCVDDSQFGEEFALMKKRVLHGASVCDDRVASQLLESLFGNQNNVESCSFIPLQHNQKSIGVVVLGSNERSRFQPGMGTIYLDRIGQLVGAFLSRCI
ncbi:MAG: DUF484 family protein [bacterium]